MRMLGRSQPSSIRHQEPIRADWLNQIVRWLLRNVSINGAKFQHIGGCLVMDIPSGQQRGRLTATAMGKVTAVTGTSHAAVYDVESLDGAISLESATPYMRPIDSGGDIVEAAVDDWATLARVEDSNGREQYILWEVPEVVETDTCVSGLGPQTVTSDHTVAATDTTILADASSASVQVTLPAAETANQGRIVRIKRIDSHASNTVTIIVASSGTLDEATTTTLRRQYECVNAESDGTEWWAV